MATQKGIVSLPSSGGEAGLNRYLAEIKKFPILSPEEEYMLAKRWREHGDTEAAAKLVNSHLRLVAKIAMGYPLYIVAVAAGYWTVRRARTRLAAAEPPAASPPQDSADDALPDRRLGLG